MQAQNPNPTVSASTHPRRSCDVEATDDEARDEIDAMEVFDMIRDINDPEHPLTLEQLSVATPNNILVSPPLAHATSPPPSGGRQEQPHQGHVHPNDPPLLRLNPHWPHHSVRPPPPPHSQPQRQAPPLPPLPLQSRSPHPLLTNRSTSKSPPARTCKRRRVSLCAFFSSFTS
jgi:hypothetical protein